MSGEDIMEAVPVTEFLNFTFEEINAECHRSMNVLFSDGVLHLNPNEIKFNRIVWDIFKTITNVPIRKKHSITEHYVNGIFTGGSFLKVLECVYVDVIEYCCRPTHSRAILNDYLFEKFQDIYNEVYNKIVCEKWEYCTSVDVLDFMEIQFQPQLLDAMRRLDTDKSEKALENAYKCLDNVIMNSPHLQNNSVAKGYISGNFKRDQVKQILGPRGFVAELTSMLFQEPVCSSLLFGLRSNYEIAVESRTAAKSLHVSHQSIEQSEYLARSLQIITMRMQRLVDGDCGSTKYYEWYLDPDPIIGKSELNLLVGKNYLNEETGKLDFIKPTDTHLIGKTLKLRSPIHCQHPDQKCICVACLGELSYGIPYNTNIGHMAATEFTEKISQSILSTKHLTTSAKSIDFELGPTEVNYLVKTSDDALKLNPKGFNTKKLKYDLIIGQESARGLSGMNVNTRVDSLVPSKITRLDNIILRITDKQGREQYESLQIAFSKNVVKTKKTTHGSKVYGYLSVDFLKYIIKGNDGAPNYSLESGTDQYIINLNGWLDRGLEKMKIIEYPKLEYSFMQLIKEIRSSVSKKGILESLGENDASVEVFIQNFFNLLNNRLDINLGLIEIFGCAFTVLNKETGDAHVGRSLSGDIGCVSEIISHISLGATYGFERHRTNVLNPITFSHNNVNHLLDGYLMPQEVVEDVEKGGRY